MVGSNVDIEARRLAIEYPFEEEVLPFLRERHSRKAVEDASAPNVEEHAHNTAR